MTEEDKNVKNKKEEEIKEELKDEKLKEEREIKEPLGDIISILHYIENLKLIDDIKSPRRIKALTQLGFMMDDIRYLTFPEFLDNYPSFRSLPKEIQINRYQISEQYRYAKIQKIKEFPDILIEQDKLNAEDKENNNAEGININNNMNEEIGSSAIKEELRQFERMKRKNEMDLLNAVEFELQRQIMIKEGEAK